MVRSRSMSGNMEDNVGIPEDLRCKRSDGKEWRCEALSIPDETLCETHYNQAKKSDGKSALRRAEKLRKRFIENKKLSKMKKVNKKPTEDNVGIPEDFRCKKSDGKGWRCKALSIPDGTLCEKHYIKKKGKVATSPLQGAKKSRNFFIEKKKSRKMKAVDRKSIEDNVGIPEALRCKRSDGKGWRCKALSMPDETLCEKHFLQKKGKVANSALRGAKKLRKTFIEETELRKMKTADRKSIEDNVGIPEDLRCTRSNGMGWRCKALPLPGMTRCEKHLIQAKPKTKAKRELTDESNIYLENKHELVSTHIKTENDEYSVPRKRYKEEMPKNHTLESPVRSFSTLNPQKSNDETQRDIAQIDENQAISLSLEMFEEMVSPSFETPPASIDQARRYLSKIEDLGVDASRLREHVELIFDSASKLKRLESSADEESLRKEIEDKLAELISSRDTSSLRLNNLEKVKLDLSTDKSAAQQLRKQLVKQLKECDLKIKLADDRLTAVCTEIKNETGFREAKDAEVSSLLNRSIDIKRELDCRRKSIEDTRACLQERIDRLTSLKWLSYILFNRVFTG